MGSSVDPATLRQFAASLKPGSVLHLYSPVAGKSKFHVIINVSADRSVALLINSRPSPFIQRQQHLLCRQVPLPQATHPFLEHDSVIACHDTVALPAQDRLIDGFIRSIVTYIGHVQRGIFPAISRAAADSPLISGRDAPLIARAFGPAKP
jgi:hypothetical protein